MPAFRWTIFRAALVVFILGSAVGCNPEPYARWSTFDSGDGFRIRYLAPPWRISEEPGILLEVPANAEGFSIPDAAVVVPKFTFAASLVAGTPERLAQTERSAATGRGEELRGEVEAFTTEAGLEGVEFFSQQPATLRFHRYSFFPAGRRSLRIEFQSNLDLDQSEVDAMLASLELGD